MKLLESVAKHRGLYTLQEAAMYARMPAKTLSYWIYGTVKNTPWRGSVVEPEEGKFVTFYEFVEALAIRSLRINYRVSLTTVRAAIEEAKTKFGIPFPFANQHHRTVLIDRDLHIYVDKDENKLVGLTGKDKGQKSMHRCVEQYVKELEYDDEHMACAYTAYKHLGRNKELIQIKMNPKMHLGDPFVIGTGHTAETLWRAAIVEGGEEKAAELYEVPVDSVVAAFKYYEEIKLAA